ncbi:MAG: hypothetical protein HC888_00320 [Candidatus Competibacteraceae bacterium]|nr:hypothetical protein [Candidatus Competibacteraceae bacterium]
MTLKKMSWCALLAGIGLGAFLRNTKSDSPMRETELPPPSDMSAKHKIAAGLPKYVRFRCYLEPLEVFHRWACEGFVTPWEDVSRLHGLHPYILSEYELEGELFVDQEHGEVGYSVYVPAYGEFLVASVFIHPISRKVQEVAVEYEQLLVDSKTIGESLMRAVENAG